MLRRSLGTEGHRDMTEGQPEHGLARLCAWGAPASAFVLVKTEPRVLGLCRAKSAMPADRPVQMCPGWAHSGRRKLGCPPHISERRCHQLLCLHHSHPFPEIHSYLHPHRYIYISIYANTHLHAHTHLVYILFLIYPAI